MQNYIKTIKKLLKENIQLRKKNKELLSRISQLQHGIYELEKNNSIISKDDTSKYVIIPMILKCIEVTHKNIGKISKKRR